MRPKIWLFLIFILLSQNSFSEAITTPILIDDKSASKNLAGLLGVFEDASNQMDLEHIRQMPRGKWEPYSGQDFRAGNSRSAFWITFTMRGESSLPPNSPYMLQIDVAFLGELDIHLLRDNQLTSYFTGVSRPFKQRPYPAEIPVVPLSIGPNEEITVILRAVNEGPILVPPMLYKQQDFHIEHATRNALFGSFFSLCLVLGFYNLFLYFSIRDSSYLFYTMNILILGWFQASSRGFTTHYLWQDNFPAFAFVEPPVALWAWFTTQNLFARKFLKLDTDFKKLDKLFVGLTIVCAFLMLASFFPPNYWIWQIYSVASPLLIAIALFTGLYTYSKGLRSARFFLLGWSFFFLGGLLTTFYYLGIFPANTMTKYGVLFGSAIEGVLFSLALADRINWIQSESLLVQEQARAALEESHKTKDEFLIAVSHELRTPLNAIIGAVELSRKEHDLEKLKENNALTDTGIRRMTDSVENLICLSTLNTNTATLRQVPFTLKEGLDELIGKITRGCNEKGLSFKITVYVAEDRTFIGDVEIIRTMLKQVLENAVDFTRQGNVSLTITEKIIDRSNSILKLVIEDTGEGIPSERLAHIFEAFQQASSGYNRTHEGLGIGLNICKRLISLLGGEIRVNSIPGKGSCFELEVPMKTSE